MRACEYCQPHSCHQTPRPISVTPITSDTATVCDKIREKIRYPGRVTDSARFLKDFYVAQRAHLEQKVLFGQRKEDKFSKK